MTYYADINYNATIQQPSFIRRISAALELRKQRKALYSLTNTQLSDIGLTRSEAATEYAKSFWADIA